MAISLTTQRYAVSQTAQGTTTTFSPTTRPIPVGALAVLVMAGGSLKIPTAISDNAGGNTWNIHVTATDTGVGGVQSVAIASCQVATAITTSTVISITWSPTTNAAMQMWLFEVASAAASSAFDKSATNAPTVTTDPLLSVSCGPTAALSLADEIAFAVFKFATANASTGWVHGTNWVDPATTTLQSNAVCEYQIVSATTALTATGTWTPGGSAADAYVGAMATFKGVSAAGQAAYWDAVA